MLDVLRRCRWVVATPGAGGRPAVRARTGKPRLTTPLT
jgi:hypothetical protein